MENGVTKGTIVRSILFIITIINMILRYLDKPILQVDESKIYLFVECTISIAILVVCHWKNNSYSKNAIRADRILRRLNSIDKEEE